MGTKRLELKKSPYFHLLVEDRNLARWVSAVEQGSPNTASVYFRRVCRAAADFGRKPSDLARMSRREAKEFVHDVIDRMGKEGKLGSTVTSYVKALKHWFEWNGKAIEGKTKVRDGSDNPKYQDEVPPSREELRKILDAAGARGRAVIAMFAYGAFRPEVFGNAYGDDGLKVKDLPEMKVECESDTEGKSIGGRVTFVKVPARVMVRKKLSKMGHEYFGFVPAEACQYLASYLEWRMRPKRARVCSWKGGTTEVPIPGEALGPDSPLFSVARLRGGPRHVTTPKIREEVREAIRAAGFGWRPYVLRRYYEVNMENAEYQKLIPTEWRRFWSGWKGTISATYTVGKRLPEATIEMMREGYGRAAEKHLVTLARPTVSGEEVEATATAAALKIFGFTEAELKELGDLSKVTEGRLQQLVRDRTKRMLGLGNGKQKVVPLEDLERWIEQGWDYKRDLPNGKVVVGLS